MLSARSAALNYLNYLYVVSKYQIRFPSRMTRSIAEPISLLVDLESDVTGHSCDECIEWTGWTHVMNGSFLAPGE
jgi:hypothetical protein